MKLKRSSPYLWFSVITVLSNYGRRYRRKSPSNPISMFALFGRLFSGGEEVIQGVRFDARLELPMKPIEHMTAMAALDLPPGFANSDMALPLGLQAVALF